ncbi:MAG: NHLP family bacteriocin export ABC transporter peptidase/permease/ATPase subunit [Clostridiales bacterium]|nr:NHLP family bacteriocin export ABC transporter peptidase/permease/ATPase subunit [Clostridiales bacterium]
MKVPASPGRVAKVPVILQLEALECGAASLAMVLAYYDKWIPLEQLRVDCGVSRDGSNAKNLLHAARSHGLTAKGYRMEPQTLKEKGQFPCIIHWNFNHFVVLDGFRHNRAVLNDPARGLVEVSMEEFDQAFTGVCILLAPAEGFVPDGKPKSMLGFVRKRLHGAKDALIFTTLVSLISALIGVINPAFSRVFVDRLLTGLNPGWVTPFFVLLTVFAMIQIALSGMQAIYALKLQGKLAIKANAEFMWHVLRMPVGFFSQRMAGDIAARKSTNESIASTLINTLAPTVLNLAMMVVYLIVILRYSVVLTMIGITGMVINILVNRYISNKRINISRVQMRDTAKLASTTVAGIEMIETIKASGAENGFFEKWAGYQASVNNQNVKAMKTNAYYGLIPQLVSTLVNMLILSMGLFLILKGEFTVGMLFAFQTMLSALMAPVMELSNADTTIREMRTNMERIEDVLEYPADVEYPAEHPAEVSYDKLSGNLELRNVTFGYSRLAPPLIENFSMTLKTGQKVAFVGSSGCGKSTLSKLISGLYKPWSGEILFDGKLIDQIDRNVFTGSLAVVDQDITLFEDSIANNIKMWDSSIEDYEMILASRDAMMHEDIIQRDGGYQYRMLEGGKDFSGGQRQRMEIARVLSQDPTILIMDEATSALDAQTEYDVVKAIKDRGITCVVIAHRLSTIRDCDEIIVLDHGKIVERGTHEALMANHGVYEELILSE